MVETNERTLLEEKLKNREEILTEKESELATIEKQIQTEMQGELGQEPENV